MVQSARRVLEPARLERAARLLPGRGRRRRRTARWLLHEPIELALAREAIAAVEAEGYGLNVYVDDELYVAARHARGRALRELPADRAPRRRRPRLAGSQRPPTKLVVHRRPGRARRARRAAARASFAGRLWVTKSLPFFLEFAAEGVSKASGARRSSRAASASRASGRSPSATARTTSSSSSGAATASRSQNADERRQGGRRLGLPAGRARRASLR